MNKALEDASAAQVTAAHPSKSSWVTANAGSGKTRVLTDRVARLLLKKVEPQKILCLTYTKAAAAEMQARLFARLGAWAMLNDADLREALDKIGEQGAHFTPDALNEARTLFARALETPGGLKIQTIHAFCGHLLRRFPLEAGIAPGFAEIDETQAAALHSTVLIDIAADPDSPLDALALHLSNEAGLDNLLADILKHRDDFHRYDENALARLLGIPADLAEDDVYAELEQHAPKDDTRRIAVAVAQSGTKNEIEKKYAKLIAMPDTASPAAYFETLRASFLNKNESRPASPFTKAVQSAHPWIMDTIGELQDAIVGSLDRLRAVHFLQRSTVLATFAKDFLRRYESAKSARSLLDFDDLIDKTRDLLTAYDTTQWVLYRLDGGIEHILVDEAQDTSPRQWEVIDALSLGFTEHGPGERTVFVVGDHKQSIFGFQGADPSQIAEKREEWSMRLHATGDHLQVTPLEYSFRSAAPILHLVDTVFQDDPNNALDGPPLHRAFRDKPGRFDLWPFLEQADAQDEPGWWEPVDTERPDDPVLQLADDVAQEIANLVEAQTAIPDGSGGWRAAQPGDFLILVRSRNRFFHRLISELKSHEVPVAGADRLRIKSELAVKDLISLLRFLDNERDDLSLAEALRSPLLGLSEADLFALAHNRPGLLWEAVRNSDHHAMIETLQSLRDRVDFDRPYELLETILTNQSGRQNLLARLGAQCTEAIDELLSQALVYERNGLPTLSGFLAWLDARDVEIKRDMDAAGNEVRVMTIHGAKGLEAPIVILADTSHRQAHQNAPQVMAIDGMPFWTGLADQRPQAITDIEEERRLADKRETSRLLYVALTRAESWLIVCGAGGKADADGRWFGQVQNAADAMATSQNPLDGPRLDHLWSPVDVVAHARLEESKADISDVLDDPPPFVRETTLSPSASVAPHHLGTDADASDDALDRGTFIHALLETLPAVPPHDRAAVAKTFETGKPWEPDAISETLACLGNPDLAPVFAPETLSEVTVSARSDAHGGQEIFGRIDRLIIRSESVTAVDFKSNRTVPATADAIPQGILDQLSLYHAALRRVFPDRTVNCAIVWTATGTFMPVPHASVT